MIYEDDKVEIHGGGMKIIRMHLKLDELSEAKKRNDHNTTTWCLERLFAEVEAYLLPEEVEPMVNFFVEIEKMNDNLKRGTKQPAFYSEALKFELKIRRVMKRAELDSRLKEKEKYARSVL